MEQSMFEKNRSFLEKNLLTIDEKIVQRYCKDSVVCAYETRDKNVGLYIQNGQGIIQLNSQYSSKVYAGMWAEHVLEKEELSREHVIVVFGFGNGDYIKALVERIPDDVKIVCYEPSTQIFLKAMEHIDLENILGDKVVLFVEGINMDLFNECWRTIVSISNGSLIHAIPLPIYPRIFPEELKGLVERIQEQNELIQINWNTKKRFAKSFSENQLAMIPYFLKSHNLAELMERLPKNYPALVVAAGPSLKKNIQDIHRMKNKAFIIAVDTSIKLLLKEGIIPDIYVTVDPEKYLELFDDERIHDIPVCICPFSVKESFTKQKKKTFISLGDSYIGRLCANYNKPRGFLGTGGTVAQDAFSLAVSAGMNPIILVGQDLAYTDDETHAKGAFYNPENVKDMDQKNFIWVEDIYGNPVKTIVNLNVYRRWYENIIADKLKIKDIRVIDATEGGAKIAGTEIMTLNEVIEKECTKNFDYEQLIDSVSPLFSVEEQAELTEEFKAFPEVFMKIQKASEELKDLYERLLVLGQAQEVDAAEVKEIMLKVGELNSVIEDRLEYQLIEPYVEEAGEKAMDHLDEEGESAQEDLKMAAERGMIMMDAIQKAVPELMPKVEEMLRILAE